MYETAGDFLTGEGLDVTALVALIDNDPKKHKGCLVEKLLAMGAVHGTGWDYDRSPRNGWYSSCDLRGAPEWAIKAFAEMDQSIRDEIASELTDAPNVT